MSNIFGVYEVNLVGLVSTDDEGDVVELASLNGAAEVENVVVTDESGEVESIWASNIFGGTDE